jgi:hypothetical protein
LHVIGDLENEVPAIFDLALINPGLDLAFSFQRVAQITELCDVDALKLLNTDSRVTGHNV